MKRRSRWSYSAGRRPYRVTVYEREVGGPLWARTWDRNKKGYLRRSLGHRDQAEAMQYADEQSVKLRRGHDDLRAGITPLSMVFSAYRRHRTPKKRSAGERAEDHRRIEMWTRFLGAEADPHSIALRDWEAFIHQRASGELDARGRRVSKARPVGPRTVEKDCNWLQWVFNWAVNWRLPNNRYLMRENPIRGFETPHERNPRRPVVSQARFEAVRAKAEMVGTEIRSGTERIRRRSYLPELLDLAYYTGRRISAICALRYEDLRPQAPRPEDVPEGQPLAWGDTMASGDG